MAEARAISSLADGLRCLICQDIYKNPVTIQCGHSFCSSCITKRQHKTCPSCQEEFFGDLYIPAVGIRSLCDVYYEERKSSQFCTCCTRRNLSVGACEMCYHALCIRCASDPCQSGKEGSTTHDLTKNRGTSSITLHVCPIHEQQEANSVCLWCQESSCDSCNEEGIHRKHQDQVMKRQDVPYRLEEKSKEFCFASQQMGGIKDAFKAKKDSLLKEAFDIEWQMNTLCNELKTGVLNSIARSKTSFVDYLDQVCQKHGGEELNALLNSIQEFRQTFSVYGELNITGDNCLSVLRKQGEMEAMLTHIEEHMNLARDFTLIHELPNYDNLVTQLETQIHSAVEEFMISTDEKTEQSYNLRHEREPQGLDAASANIVQLGSDENTSTKLELITLVKDEVEFAGLSTWQLALGGGKIYLPTSKASGSALLLVDIETGEISKLPFNFPIKKRFLSGKDKSLTYNSITLGYGHARLLSCISTVCVLPNSKPRVASAIFNVTGKSLTFKRHVECESACAACFGRDQRLYFIDEDTGNLFATKEKGKMKSLTLICTIEGKRKRLTLMCFDAVDDRLWVQTGHSQLTEVTLSGSVKEYVLEECIHIGGMAVDSNGCLWISDSGAGKLLVYKQTESGLILINNTRDETFKQFNFPSSISIDGDHIAVMDKLEEGGHCFYVFKGVLAFGSSCT